MSGWPSVPFDAVLADESAGNVKTLQSEFLPSGQFAIVDQGKDLIAGYTDDASRLCRVALPVIVFGDHTRAFKYIDFPFCMGADGTKVLRPSTGADAKYLYHYLRQAPLEEAGYSRHFKFLRRLSVPLPPLPEQRRIASILDKADELRAKRRAAIAKLDTLTQAIFLDMFGDPLAKDRDGQHAPLDSVTKRITYGFTSPMRHLDSGVPIVTAKHVRERYIDFAGVHFADQAEFQALSAKSKPERGDVLVTKDGTIGRCAVVQQSVPFCINQSVALLKLDHSRVLPSYIVAWLSTTRVQQVMLNMGKGNALAHLQITELAKLPVPIPSMERQHELASRLASLEKVVAAQKAASCTGDALFASLQRAAFRGDL